ncbi:MAG TPA: methyltransferase domain-containing protein [Bacteroidota bacterium]
MIRQNNNEIEIGNYSPFMNELEVISVVEALRLFYRPIKALEWGSGNSTAYFPKYLPAGSHWTSIEHNINWANKVKALVSRLGVANIQIHHVPNSDGWSEGLGDGTIETFREYVLFPETLQEKFQLILVDGRSRAECMQVGWMLLESPGIMILHDAQRSKYDRGIPGDCFFLRITNPRIDIDGQISTLFMSRSMRVTGWLHDALRSILPDYILIDMDQTSLSEHRKRMTWLDLLDHKSINLYAGEIPKRVEYENCIGLSLSHGDSCHIHHDITMPFPLDDETIDSFQSEDVFEHIAYDMLNPIIQEIFRVLKPGGLFRLSMPDYRCDVLYERSIRNDANEIIFDPGGGGTPDNPGHLWFPTIERVTELLNGTQFSERGKINYLQYYKSDGSSVTRPIDYSHGFVQRTPDHDARVQSPYRPMSLVVDLIK